MAASHRFFALFVLVAVVVAPRAEAQVASLTDYGPIRDRRLANGLRVIVQEDHRTPIVSLEIRYDAGSRYEPAGREGLARVVLDAMVRATKHVGVHEYGDILLRAGATWSSRVERDYVRMSATLPSSRIELPMWLWSDQMGFFASAFDEKALDETRATVMDSEVKWRDSQPLGRVPLFLDRALYPVGHPYRSSGAATKEGLAALTVADVRAFHERVFVPDRATLVVVGDVKATDAFAYAEKYVGPVPRGLGGAFPFAAPPRLTGETRLSVDAHVSTPSVWIRWPTPAFYAPGDADLDVVARLFSGRSRAHLFWKLVDERKVATAVFAHQSSAALGSSFDLRVTGVAGGDARALLSEVDRALGELVATLLPLDDVRTAENEVTFHMAFNLEKTSERAWAFANFTAYHDDTDYFSTEVGRHGAVTDLTVRTTAKRYLPLDRRIVALVTPSRDAPLGGALIGQELTPAGVK